MEKNQRKAYWKWDQSSSFRWKDERSPWPPPRWQECWRIDTRGLLICTQDCTGGQTVPTQIHIVIQNFKSTCTGAKWWRGVHLQGGATTRNGLRQRRWKRKQSQNTDEKIASCGRYEKPSHTARKKGRREKRKRRKKKPKRWRVCGATRNLTFSTLSATALEEMLRSRRLENSSEVATWQCTGEAFSLNTQRVKQPWVFVIW